MGDGGKLMYHTPHPGKDYLLSFLSSFLPLKNYLVAAFLFLIILTFYLLTFICTGSSLLHVGFLELQRTGGYFLVLVIALLLAVASLVLERRLLELRLSSYGTQA